MMCLLWVRIFNFHIFAYFSPKIVKIKPEIGNFQPKCWNMKYKIFQKLRNRTPWKFNKVRNVKCSFRMQYDDVITNPRWRTDSPITWWNICGNCGACWSKSELIGKNNLWLGWGTDGGFPLTWYHTCNGGLIKTLWDRCRKNPGFQLQEPGGSTTYLQIRNHLSESDENSSGQLLFTKRCRLHRWEGDDWCQEFWRRISTRISNGGQHVSCHYCEAYD